MGGVGWVGFCCWLGEFHRVGGLLALQLSALERGHHGSDLLRRAFLGGNRFVLGRRVIGRNRRRVRKLALPPRKRDEIAIVAVVSGWGVVDARWRVDGSLREADRRSWGGGCPARDRAALGERARRQHAVD